MPQYNLKNLNIWHYFLKDKEKFIFILVFDYITPQAKRKQ